MNSGVAKEAWKPFIHLGLIKIFPSGRAACEDKNTCDVNFTTLLFKKRIFSHRALIVCFHFPEISKIFKSSQIPICGCDLYLTHIRNV